MMKIITKNISLVAFVLVLVALGYVSSTFSQSGETGFSLPEPIILSSYNAGAGSGSQINEEGTRAMVIVKLPDNTECDCAPIIEARKKGDQDWIPLVIFPVGAYMPEDEESDGESEETLDSSVNARAVNSEWFVESEIFDTNIDYEVRAMLYDNFGGKSRFITKEFKMTPSQSFDEQCATNGIDTQLITSFNPADGFFLTWCTFFASGANNVPAQSYKVYKSGNLVSEQDAQIYLTDHAPMNNEWIVEGYSSIEPDSFPVDPPFTKKCEQIIPNINHYVPTGGVKAAKLNECIVINGKLRAIVEWESVSTNFSEYNLPASFLGREVQNNSYNFWKAPRIPRLPGDQGGGLIKSEYEPCLLRGFLGAPNSFSELDPWGDTSWKCETTLNYSALTIVYRTWINFDATKSHWPVKLRVTY